MVLDEGIEFRVDETIKRQWRGWMGCRDSIGLPCVNGIGDNWLVRGGADTRVESLCDTDSDNFIWATRCR